MGFRFRHSARLGPLRFHFSRNGLSSLSLGGPGASLNLPVGRGGGPRATVGLPGTGLSWSLEQAPERPPAIPAGAAAGLPNSRQLRPAQLAALRAQVLELLQSQLFGPGSRGRILWEQELVRRLRAQCASGGRRDALLAVIETPRALEAYLGQARSQAEVRRRATRVLEAVRQATRLAAARGWLP